jgi:hypothetical protein
MAAQPARSPPFRACDSAAGFDTRHCHGQVRRFGVTALMDVFRTLVERVIRSDITDCGGELNHSFEFPTSLRRWTAGNLQEPVGGSCVPDAVLAPSRSTTVAQNTNVAWPMLVTCVLEQRTV